MRAVVITEATGIDGLKIQDYPKPEDLGPEDVCIAVKAVGINRADILQAQGRYPAPAGVPQDIPGLEYAGVVDAIGSQVTRWSVGDRVMGLVGGGAYAEFLTVHGETVLPMPKGMDFTEAAAIPEAFMTAYDALILQGGLQAGDRALIHALGSGVGSAGLQLVRWAGATALGTSRQQNKVDMAQSLGAHGAVLAQDARFAEAILEHYGPVDVVMDLVGGSYLSEEMLCLRKGGRIVLVGLLAGRTETVDLGRILRGRVHLIGTVLRSRGLDEKIDLARRFAQRVLPAFESGALKPVVAQVWGVGEFKAGMEFMLGNGGVGKLVLTF